MNLLHTRQLRRSIGQQGLERVEKDWNSPTGYIYATYISDCTAQCSEILDFRFSIFDIRLFSRKPEPCRQTGTTTTTDGTKMKDGIRIQDGVKTKDGIRIKDGIRTAPILVGTLTTIQAICTPHTNNSHNSHNTHNMHKDHIHFLHHHHHHHQQQCKSHQHSHTQQSGQHTRQHATIHMLNNNRPHHNIREWFTHHQLRHRPTHHTQHHQPHSTQHHPTPAATHKQHQPMYKHQHRHNPQEESIPLHIMWQFQTNGRRRQNIMTATQIWEDQYTNRSKHQHGADAEEFKDRTLLHCQHHRYYGMDAKIMQSGCYHKANLLELFQPEQWQSLYSLASWLRPWEITTLTSIQLQRGHIRVPLQTSRMTRSNTSHRLYNAS